MTTTNRTKPPITTTESVSPSALLHCEIHKQTKAIVLARWDQVPGLSRERAKDLTVCGCCTGPALYPGVSSMKTLEEVGGISPLCSRCDVSKVDSDSAAGTGLGLSEQTTRVVGSAGS